MLDHVGLNVRDGQAAKAWYAQALEPLGYRVGMEVEVHVGFESAEGQLDFWLSQRGDTVAPAHVGFRAGDRAAVEAFHRAAVAAGGTDNGGPGLRPEYHATYYSAYVLDPEGNNIEAVCHTPA